jgi:hypothetical protein
MTKKKQTHEERVEAVKNLGKRGYDVPDSRSIDGGPLDDKMTVEVKTGASITVDVKNEKLELLMRLNIFAFEDGSSNVDVIVNPFQQTARMACWKQGKQLLSHATDGVAAHAVIIYPRK